MVTFLLPLFITKDARSPLADGIVITRLHNLLEELSKQHPSQRRASRYSRDAAGGESRQ